jgi:hypothetical protein
MTGMDNSDAMNMVKTMKLTGLFETPGCGHLFEEVARLCDDIFSRIEPFFEIT